MAFPSSHKTVFILDHTLNQSSGVKLDLESLSKGRSSSSSQQGIHHIPLLPVVKTIWTCAVESIMEYCRIVWDIFPSSRLIRFLASTKTVQKLNTWNQEDQNLTSLMNMFIGLGPAKSGFKAILEKAITEAIVYLTEPSPTQQQKMANSVDSSSKVLNKGRIIVMTSVESDADIKLIKDKCQESLMQLNKTASNTDSLMPVHHCDLIIVSFLKDGDDSRISLENWTENFSPLLSCTFFTLPCGQLLAPRLCSLVLKHYDLASTTVTGIPMKEEQNASSSANYDVELFHPAASHTAILKGLPAETAHLKTIRDGTDYETITLKWCTPRSNASSELQHCSSANRITSVDVNSRPSSCLTNFLLNGRWVMLEMPRKGGSKVISHMLACHGGDIYIHTLNTSRSVLEDPPSISEGGGGKVTDYRIGDFESFISSHLLAPYPPCPNIEEGEDTPTPLETSVALLKRKTIFWPLTHSSTILFSLGQVVSPLSALLPLQELTEEEIIEAKNVIYALMGMEARGEVLPTLNAKVAKNGGRKEEVYKSLWTELESFLRSHLHSKGHEKILECLLECLNKVNLNGSSQNGSKEEKVDLDQALRVIEADSGKHPCPSSKTISKKQKTSTTKGQAVNLLTLWEAKVSAELSHSTKEFQGRLKAENNKTKLYTHLENKEKEKDESRKEENRRK